MNTEVHKNTHEYLIAARKRKVGDRLKRLRFGQMYMYAHEFIDVYKQ